MSKHQHPLAPQRAARNHALKILSIATLFVFAISAQAQRYNAGDIVQNFTLTNRATNQPVSLHDFEGKIVFLEWFAYWCPFCQAAASQTETGIVQHYANGGNVDGIPVIHVSINLESSGANLTQQFIDKYHLNLVLNDYDRSLANRFAGGGQPIFAIINGVENSSTHQQWELVYSRLGYGDTQHPIGAFQAAIDSVKMGAAAVEPPEITQQPLAARIATGASYTLSVQANGSELVYQWKKDNTPLSGQTSSQLQLSDASLADSGRYSVDISNSGGLVSSAEADLKVVQSLPDFLASAGLSDANLAADADPDRDGYPNALEYLAQTNPNSATDVPKATLEFTSENSVPALRIQFESSPETIGYDLAAYFWSYPSSAGNSMRPLSLGQSSEVIEPIPAAATTFLGRLQATPSQ